MIGSECRCGLHWRLERRGMSHYAVSLYWSDAERLRDRIAFRLTRRILDETS